MSKNSQNCYADDKSAKFGRDVRYDVLINSRRGAIANDNQNLVGEQKTKWPP